MTTESKFMTGDEADNVAQALGLRLIDWRRMSNEEAGEWMTEKVNRIGFDVVSKALARTRELSGKMRVFQLAAICSMGIPGVRNLLKEPPDWSTDELWRSVFNAMLYDLLRTAKDADAKRLIDQAMDEQVSAS